jgi:hypothetical protein
MPGQQVTTEGGRIFSLNAFSYDAYFHYASSPTTPTFIPRILLQRLRKKEGAERKSHFGKSLRDPKCKFSKKFSETLSNGLKGTF